MKLNIFVLCFIAVACASELPIMNDEVILQMIQKPYNPEKESNQCNNRYEENYEKAASSIFDIRYDSRPKKCETNDVPKNCAEATACTQRSGLYRILLTNQPLLVECDVQTDGGDWTLIQRRQDGSENFYRDWNEYKKGFGSISGEFFIGLDNLHALTNYNGPQELLVLLKDQNETRRASYSNFVVGDESESYVLKSVGVFSGDAGDSLTTAMGAKFTTKDRDNDDFKDNCAVSFTGAWWYKACHLSNLNGKYGDTAFGKGVNWQTYRGHTASIQQVKMMIRRRPINI